MNKHFALSKKVFVLLFFSFIIVAGLCGCRQDPQIIQQASQPADTVISQIQDTEKTFFIDIDGHIFEIVLENNRTAESFIELLPAQYEMKELNGNEKYIYIEEKLPTNQSVPDMIFAGDIKLYGKNCIVLFYKTFATQYSYTSIGHLKECENLEDIVGKGSITCKIYCG